MAEAWAEGSGPWLEAGAWQLLAGDWWLEARALGQPGGNWQIAAWLPGWWLEWLGPWMKTQELGWRLGVGNRWLEARGQVLAARGFRVFRCLVDWLVGWLVGLLVDCLIGQCS